MHTVSYSLPGFHVGSCVESKVRAVKFGWTEESNALPRLVRTRSWAFSCSGLNL